MKVPQESKTKVCAKPGHPLPTWSRKKHFSGSNISHFPHLPTSPSRGLLEGHHGLCRWAPDEIPQVCYSCSVLAEAGSSWELSWEATDCPGPAPRPCSFSAFSSCSGIAFRVPGFGFSLALVIVLLPDLAPHRNSQQPAFTAACRSPHHW